MLRITLSSLFSRDALTHRVLFHYLHNSMKMYTLKMKLADVTRHLTASLSFEKRILKAD